MAYFPASVGGGTVKTVKPQTDIISYNSHSNYYEVLNDGYIKLVLTGTAFGQSMDMRAIDSSDSDTTISLVRIWDAQANYSNVETVFVKKGMKVWFYVPSGVTAHAYYIELQYN